MNLYAERILLANGWATNTSLTIENGLITAIVPGVLPNAKCLGTVIPGMINCHSHAFQRAFAGFSEQGSEGNDSFWTWRQVMYKFLKQLTVDNAELIASQLYIEMLKMGYTRVAEFHYLHHDIDGQQYPELATMAGAIFKAAKNTGIGLTLLPVLYRYSGFGSKPAVQGQQRFINTVEQFNQLVSDCFSMAKTVENTNVGIAPHSLRAVDKTSLQQAVAHVRSLDSQAPIHIHIAEQQKEVADCLTHYGQRPVAWLAENIALDQQWCLIHATHIDAQEQLAIIAKGAVAGICPTTEANLGDGIFPTTEFLAQQGTIAIGSDSHISVNPVEELRWLEYTQRLIKQQRAILATTEQPSVGANLWQKAAMGGAQSTNSNTGELAVGKQADLLVLDADKIALFADDQQYLMDSLMFASQTNMVRDVMVNGKWVIVNGQHQQQDLIGAQFTEMLATLAG